jgi:hypothetical protein
MQALVASDNKNIAIQFANKRVEVDLANQRLRAYQGARLVLDSPYQQRARRKEDAPGRIQGRANQIADASLPALSQRPDAVECAGAREYFYSRIPEGPTTSRPRTVAFACP